MRRVDRVDAGADDLADAARRTTVFGGTPKIFHPFGSLPFAPASSTTLLCSSLSLSATGPARSFCLLSNRYHVVLVFLSTRACWPARSEYSESFAIGKPCALDRRRDEIGLEVEELELRGLAEDLDHLLRVLDARQVDHDLVVALLADLGLGDAEPVDAVARISTERSRSDFCSGRLAGRHGLQRHLETALEVEPERRRLLDRRSGNGEQPDADESGGDQRRRG